MNKRKRSDFDSSNKESRWNFEVEYNDHFETPSQAYVDLLPALLEVANELGKTLGDLVVYDPYYCEGRMLKIFEEIGVVNVINRNQDFYRDISSDNLPGTIVVLSIFL